MNVPGILGLLATMPGVVAIRNTDAGCNGLVTGTGVAAIRKHLSAALVWRYYDWQQSGKLFLAYTGLVTLGLVWG